MRSSYAHAEGAQAKVRIQRVVVLAALVAGVVATPAVGIAAAEPADARPIDRGAVPAAVSAAGVPEAPVTLFVEDFENVTTPGQAQFLDTYTGDAPLQMTYTAHPSWISGTACNGVIAAYTSASNGTCVAAIFNGYSRTLARGIGEIFGGGTANHAMTDATAVGSPAAPSPAATIETLAPVPLSAASRYIAFSVDVAATNCSLAPAQLRFYLLDGADAVSVNSAPINGCTLPGGQTVVVDGRSMRVGSFATDRALLFSGDAVGIRLSNDQTNGNGNDYAVDNIRLLDATPQLDKSFGAMHPVTGVARVTFTVTNTSELGEKSGWSATDTLPAGLVVAATPNASTTCTDGAVTAPAGADTISFSGDLAGTVAQRTSCTIEVDVSPVTPTAQGAAAQTFQNCPANFTAIVGLDLPAECATASFPAVARLAVSKSSTVTAATAEGDVVTYTVVATNTGGAAYTAAAPAVVTDDLSAVLDDATYNADASASAGGTIAYAAPTLTWSGALEPGASVILAYSVTMTLDGNGSLVNTACVPAGQASADACATVTTDIVIDPSIALTKSVSPSGVDDFVVDQVLTYTFVVTNDGNLVLENPGVTELTFEGAGVAPVVDCPPTPTLAPGEQMTCTADYTVVQADVDDHSLTEPMDNSAHAEATASDGKEVVSEVSTAAVPGVQTPAITVVKSAAPGAYSAAGQTVAYEFLVTNTGNVTLTDAEVVETGFSGTGPDPVVSCPAGASTMLPGAQVTCTASYELTQADVDAGSVTNVAVASALPPTGDRVPSDPDDALVTIGAAPALSLIKSAGPGEYAEAGQTVMYTFEVVNTGNVTLSGLVIDETAFSGTGALGTPVCDRTTLAPAEPATCTVAYALTQADVDAGILTNGATAVATPPVGDDVPSAVSTALVEIDPVASVSLLKSVDRPVVAGAGAAVAYRFTVTNSGQSTLTGIVIDEVEFSGTGALTAVDCPAVPVAPGASVTCTAGYRTTDADVVAQTVTNTARAAAVDPFGVDVSSDTSSAVVEIDPVAAALADTGAALAPLLVVGALGLAVGGVGLVMLRLRGTAARV